MRPYNYDYCTACANCLHCFVDETCDSGQYFHCTLGSLPRPRSSTEITFSPIEIGSPEYYAANAIWRAWAEVCEVASYGTCPKWEVRSLPIMS